MRITDGAGLAEEMSGDSMKQVSWINLGLGLWLMVAPLSLHASGISAVNSVVMGLVVSVIAVLSLRATPGNHLPAWINLAAGFWVFFSPWALNINGQTPVLVKSAITGALIIIFALARTTAGRPASV